MFMSFSQIAQEQKKSLNYKIDTAVKAIQSGFEVAGKCSLAFSGGKDSTVLWHLIRSYFPDKQYSVIFGNTGVEFPESLSFARKLGQEWGGDDFYEVKPALLEKDGLKYQAQREVLAYLEANGLLDRVLKKDGKLKTTNCLEKMATPEMWDDFRRRKLVWKKGSQKNYFWCVDQYGYPILGKTFAGKLTARRINIDCFLKFSRSASTDSELMEYYDLLKEVKISNHCCCILKKEPSERLQAELGIDLVFKGLMAAESRTRTLSFSTRGYLFKSYRPHCGDFYHCQPMAIWTDADVWEYIQRFQVPYSELYDMEYMDSKGRIRKINRNGCVGCGTDLAFKDNHLSALKQTHPKLWKSYMLNTGLGAEIIKLSGTKSKKKPKADYSGLGQIDPRAADEAALASSILAERMVGLIENHTRV